MGQRIRLIASFVVGTIVTLGMASATAYGQKDEAPTVPTQEVPLVEAPMVEAPPVKVPTTTSTSTTTSTTSTTIASVPSSGQGVPTSNPAGWKLVMSDDFTTDVPLGGFPGPGYSAKWDVYKDGTKDTTAQNKGGNGRYYPSKVVSVKNGMLNKYLHTENGIAMTAALLPKASFGQTYGRYSVRFRSDPVPGYKTAYLLWPDSESWPNDGEIDYPEGNLNSTFYGASIFAQPGNAASDKFPTSAKFTDWHTATTEWTPGKVTFILDGKVVGSSTTKVPSKPMHWVLQTETCTDQCSAPTATAKGNLQIDWVAMWSRG